MYKGEVIIVGFWLPKDCVNESYKVAQQKLGIWKDEVFKSGFEIFAKTNLTYNEYYLKNKPEGWKPIFAKIL